jgi:hypothetical protein
MLRDRPHFVLSGVGHADPFKPKGGGGSTKRPSNVVDRAGHARSLLRALDLLPNIVAEARPGIYLDVQGRPNEVMVTGGLNVSDLTLLKADPLGGEQRARATVFATPKGLETLRTKIDDFATKDRKREDGTKGRPYNADLVSALDADA